MSESSVEPAVKKSKKDKRIYKAKDSRKMKARREFASEIEALMSTIEVDKNIETPMVEEKEDELDTQGGLNSLPNEILYEILKYLQVPDRCPVHKVELERKSFYDYGKQKRKMLKEFWRLRGVNRKLRDFLDNLLETKKFERPGVGMRIMNKPPKQIPSKAVFEPDNLVLVFIYGAKGEKLPCQCVPITELAAALRPCVVTTNLLVHGLVIDDLLIESLKTIDLSLVEEVRFHDVRGVNLVNREESLRELVSLFPNAMEVEFVGRRINFDPALVFPADLEKTLEMERVDEEILTKQLTVKYKKVGQRKKRRTRKSRAARLARRAQRDEEEALQNRIQALMHVPGGDYELVESDLESMDSGDAHDDHPEDFSDNSDGGPDFE